jgi:SOS-response transcriptional repressor LexA
MKGKFPNGLRECLAAANVPQAELARAAKTSPQNINRFVQEERDLNREWALRLAPHLPGISPANLIFGLKTENRTKKVPVVSWVSAGRFAETQVVMESDSFDRYIDEILPDGDWIAFEVIGDSMNYVAPEGAYIFVNRRVKNLINGYFYAVAMENGDATFKRYRSQPNRLEPMSTNPVHQTHFFQEDETVRVIGRVEKVVNNLVPDAKKSR